MILKMNQDTHGEGTESPRMIFDSTRLHKTWGQEIMFLKNFKILSPKMKKSTISAHIQNLEWIQLESTLKIMGSELRILHLEYTSILEIWISEVSRPLAGGPSDSPNMSPGGECFAPNINNKSSKCTPKFLWSEKYCQDLGFFPLGSLEPNPGEECFAHTITSTFKPKGRFTIDLSQPTRRSITPGLVLLCGRSTMQ